jgi:hypothetical protein
VIVDVVVHGDEIPAEGEVEGEFLVDAEIVLEVEVGDGQAGGGGGIDDVAVHAGGQAE